MIKIAPSILSADFANLQRDIERISTADYVHPAGPHCANKIIITIPRGDCNKDLPLTPPLGLEF